MFKWLVEDEKPAKEMKKGWTWDRRETGRHSIMEPEKGVSVRSLR